MDRETIPQLQLTESSVPTAVMPWSFWDRPFVHATDNLETFLLFLTDEEARTYELANLTAYSVTVRVTGPDNSSVLYTTSVLKAGRDERQTLYEALRSHPRYMSRFLREKLSSHVGWFFSLKKFR